MWQNLYKYYLIGYNKADREGENMPDKEQQEISFSGSAEGVFAEERCYQRDFSMVVQHFHESVELYFLLEGERFYFIEQNTYHIKQQMAVLINRNQIHKTSAAPGNKEHKRFLLQIDMQKLFPYLKAAGFSDAYALTDRYWGVAEFSDEDWSRVQQLLQAIRHEMQSPDQQVNIYAALHTVELLLLFARNRHSEPAEWKQKKHMVCDTLYIKVHEIALYIQNNSEKSLSLEQLAKEFYISRSYLTRIFRQTTGFTVVQYQTFWRIKKARALLSNTQMGVTEISEQLGFGNVTYFERVFKTIVGISPREYRKSDLKM